MRIYVRLIMKSLEAVRGLQCLLVYLRKLAKVGGEIWDHGFIAVKILRVCQYLEDCDLEVTGKEDRFEHVPVGRSHQPFCSAQG